MGNDDKVKTNFYVDDLGKHIEANPVQIDKSNVRIYCNQMMAKLV